MSVSFIPDCFIAGRSNVDEQYKRVLAWRHVPGAHTYNAGPLTLAWALRPSSVSTERKMGMQT